jgi:hypothetical protein
MKCINCNIDNTLKDRRMGNMGRCKSCNHEFAFEPTLMPESNRLTDTFFSQLVSDLSAKDTLFFTPNQLYYLLNKRLQSRSGNRSTGVSMVAGGLVFTLLGSILFKGVLKISFDEGIPTVVTLCMGWTIWQISQDSISSQFNRRIRHDRIVSLKTIAIALLIIALPLSIGGQILEGIIGSIGLAIAATVLYVNRNRQQSQIFDIFSIDRSQFDLWLEKWTSINNQPSKILPPPQTSILPVVPNPEVTAYSFDRVVVCDTPEIAQLLISNNFHFENNCAILTIDGYPQNIFDPTMEMLVRNPDLKVYALHNCSPNGIELPHRLRAEEKWFPNPAIPIINVGILPRQIVDNFNLTILQSAESAEISQRLALNIRTSLNPAEIAWLDAGCYLELESLSPRRIIHFLQQAINQNHELTAIEGDGTAIVDRSNFYTVDSFG